MKDAKAGQKQPMFTYSKHHNGQVAIVDNTNHRHGYHSLYYDNRIAES